jgi:AraC-like DNA-binding protein
MEPSSTLAPRRHRNASAKLRKTIKSRLRQGPRPIRGRLDSVRVSSRHSIVSHLTIRFLVFLQLNRGLFIYFVDHLWPQLVADLAEKSSFMEPRYQAEMGLGLSGRILSSGRLPTNCQGGSRSWTSRWSTEKAACQRTETIRALLKTTEVSVQEIAMRFGVSRSTLYRNKLHVSNSCRCTIRQITCKKIRRIICKLTKRELSLA